MVIEISLSLWALTVTALFISLLINALAFILYLGKKRPHLIYKEN